MASSLILASHSPSSSSNSSTPESSPRGIVSDKELRDLQRQAEAVDFMNKSQRFKRVGHKSSQSSPSGRISSKQTQDLINTREQLIILDKQAADLERKNANMFKRVIKSPVSTL